jgi:hypothetical protein
MYIYIFIYNLFKSGDLSEELDENAVEIESMNSVIPSFILLGRAYSHVLEDGMLSIQNRN